MAYTEQADINVRFHPGEPLPKVGEVREARGLAHWKYEVLRIIKVSDPDEQGRVMVKMHVQRWIVEEETK